MSKQQPMEPSSDLLEAVSIREKVIPYLLNLGYSSLVVELPIETGSRILFADVVAYLDEAKSIPYVVVEVKRKLQGEVTILDAAVQQAFSTAVALGKDVRYLLVTDTNRYYWFECNVPEGSLVLLPEPPKHHAISRPVSQVDPILVPITDPAQFYGLLWNVLDALRSDHMNYGLRLATQLNQVLIAKLYDEQTIRNGGQRRFRSDQGSEEEINETINELYLAAIKDTSVDVPYLNSWTWTAPPLVNVVRCLEPYALSSVTASLRGRFFWHTLQRQVRRTELQHTTPSPLAPLLVHLARPQPGERVIDPACGTGLFLVETLAYIEDQALSSKAKADASPTQQPSDHSIVGVERDLEVATFAATTLLLNDLSHAEVFGIDALDKQVLKQSGILGGTFDIVLLDPPFGQQITDQRILSQYELPWLSGRPQSPKSTSELLFIELAVELLRPGGRAVLLVPDSVLFLDQHIQVREWLLQRMRPRAIISLPREALAPIGRMGKVSVLLLEDAHLPSKSSGHVLVAAVDNVGYSSLGSPRQENDLPELINAIDSFLETGQLDKRFTGKRPLIWQIDASELNAEHLNVRVPDYEFEELLEGLQRSQYPTSRLDEIAELISGAHFPDRVPPDLDTAILLQAGVVRDLEIDTETSPPPHISEESYRKSKRAQLQLGDVLVTTTGQYLGRAAAVESLPRPAVASSAVTLLRSKDAGVIDPFFLAAVICSEIGLLQIDHRQAPSTAQPYIRRGDLGSILIPIPPIEMQRHLSQRIKALRTKSKELAKEAQKIELLAHMLVASELLQVNDNE